MLTHHHPRGRPTPDRVPITLYIAADEKLAARPQAVHCRRYAELRNCTVVLTAADPVPNSAPTSGGIRT